MNAYDYDLMPRAQKVMGSLFDTSINFYGIKLDDFYHMFLNSPISKKIERGDPAIIEGHSGRELSYSLLENNGFQNLEKPEYYSIGRNKSYWLGWTMAYYQWYKGISFSRITDGVDIDVYWNMYDKYHEMDVLQFVDRADVLRRNAQTESKLKRLRGYAKLSQSQLAEKSGVPIRTIQQYEQKAKDINRANVDYVVRLSKVLNCDVDMLLEEF